MLNFSLFYILLLSYTNLDWASDFGILFCFITSEYSPSKESSFNLLSNMVNSVLFSIKFFGFHSAIFEIRKRVCFNILAQYENFCSLLFLIFWRTFWDSLEFSPIDKRNIRTNIGFSLLVKYIFFFSFQLVKFIQNLCSDFSKFYQFLIVVI